MSFDFKNYEIYGKGLKLSTEEVHLRNSVSRGYYAFYHKVKKLLGYTDSQYAKHDDLIKGLLADKFKDGAKLSNYMRTCKTQREQADYYKNPNNSIMSFTPSRVNTFWGSYDYYINLLKEQDPDE
jgi:uncharacterized protein (UPF0332 family)